MHFGAVEAARYAVLFPCALLSCRGQIGCRIIEMINTRHAGKLEKQAFVTCKFTKFKFLLNTFKKIIIFCFITVMAIAVVEFSNGGYKISKSFAKESTYSNEIIEF